MTWLADDDAATIGPVRNVDWLLASQIDSDSQGGRGLMAHREMDSTCD